MAIPRMAGIGAPPRVQAGDLAVGRHVGVDVPIFNLDPTADAVLSVALTGAPSLSLVSAPDRLWPSRSGFDPSKVVRLEFRPTEVGRIHGDVAVTMSWPNGSRPDETVHIEVAGGAHQPNDEPLDVQDAMRASHELTRQAEGARDTQRARTDQAILDEEQRDTHYHEGHKRRLDNARSRAAINLTAVYSARHDGIEKAGEEIGEFVRHLPPESGSLAQDLAGFALDLASAAIAGGLAKRLEPGIKKIFGNQGLERNVTDFVIVPGHDRQDAGPGIVGLVADGVKHVTKAVGKRGKEVAMPGTEHQDERHGAVSLDAKSDFLETHRAALRNDTAERAAEVTIRTHDALLPTLQTDHEKAIAAMNEVAVQLGAEAQAASGIQKHQSHLQWIRLVAQTSLGSTDASTATPRGLATRGDASLTDMARANQTRDENTPMKRHDGLIDITFTGSEAHPEQKVKVTGIKLTGVRSLVAEEIKSVRLLDLGLPVRASGFLGGPSASVTVVRDEGGNISFTDHTTVPWQQATWLARKAGVVTHGGNAEERRGARTLIEDEIMAKKADEFENVKLETDGES